jgi:CRP-like cAMP-binding protein
LEIRVECKGCSFSPGAVNWNSTEAGEFPLKEAISMANSLTMKLEQFVRFDQEDRNRLDGLLSYPTKTFSRGEVIIEEGKEVRNIHLLLTGLAARNKVLADGRRQIMAFLIPGDLCDIEVFVLKAMDHNITAMSDTTIVLIPSWKWAMSGGKA